jgi:hypothetical protein
MREIISVQVGQCGNQIGGKFWEALNEEHGINEEGLYHGTNPDQREHSSVYYTQVDDNRYVPRAVLVDLGMNSMNEFEFDLSDSQSLELWKSSKRARMERCIVQIAMFTAKMELVCSILSSWDVPRLLTIR